ncbi:MAG TPA: hypothetical protein VMR97_07820, partial [Acidimicrobiales bacterium]|nr:hypothetical protein [Acidimicrobiales bacterium]
SMPWVFERLEETLRWNFPQIPEVKVETGWSGPVCGSVNCFATVGWLGSGERIAYSVGYAGHGVGPTHLSAKVLRDMLLGRRTDLLELPMRSKRPVPMPPHPIRTAILNSTQRMLQRYDDRGDEPATALGRLALRALQ